MYGCELDHKESWARKNWCFGTVVLEKTLESPLDCKETRLFNRKGNESWMFTGRTDAETEAPILWPPGKDPEAGKEWRQEEKGPTEEGTVGWRHRLDGHEFEKTRSGAQGSMACAGHGVTKGQTRLCGWTEHAVGQESHSCFFLWGPPALSAYTPSALWNRPLRALERLCPGLKSSASLLNKA